MPDCERDARPQHAVTAAAPKRLVDAQDGFKTVDRAQHLPLRRLDWRDHQVGPSDHRIDDCGVFARCVDQDVVEVGTCSIQISAERLGRLVPNDIDALGLGFLLPAVAPPLGQVRALIHVDHRHGSTSKRILAGDVDEGGGLACATLAVDGGDHGRHPVLL